MSERDSTEFVELWKSVVGFEGVYSISSLGRLRRDVTGSNSKAGYILTPLVRKSGYCCYTVWRDGKMSTFLVHRLMALAFIPNPDGKPHINHRDGNPSNNALDNLEWCTPMENARHAIEVLGHDPKARTLAAIPFGDGHYKSKLTQAQVDDIRSRAAAGKINQSDVGREFGVNKRTINSLLKGASWKRSMVSA